ncbi:MAG: hypothetical protein ABI262_09560 [Microcoleus sp.]
MLCPIVHSDRPSDICGFIKGSRPCAKTDTEAMPNTAKLTAALNIDRPFIISSLFTQMS